MTCLSNFSVDFYTIDGLLWREIKVKEDGMLGYSTLPLLDEVHHRNSIVLSC
jgi:hypothetical protein